MIPNKDTSYCDGNCCDKIETCLRWKGHYEFDGLDHWMLSDEVCIANGYCSYYERNKR